MNVGACWSMAANNARLITMPLAAIVTSKGAWVAASALNVIKPTANRIVKTKLIVFMIAASLLCVAGLCAA